MLAAKTASGEPEGRRANNRIGTWILGTTASAR